MLDGVLAVVRELGRVTSLEVTLDLIADAVVDVLGFGAAAINVTTPDGQLRVSTVVGPPGLHELLGTSRPKQDWLDVLAEAEPWGELRFFSHERDQAPLEHFITWSPNRATGPELDAWHPDDSLLAPLWDEQHQLVGVLSVDEPRTGRHPDLEQRSVLEAFAFQAAKAIRDAQVRIAADAARNELESRWRLAFAHSPTGAALVAADGRITEVNDALVLLLGYTGDELTRMTISDITHPDDIEADGPLFAELIDGSRDGYAIEKRYLRSDSAVLHALLHVGVVRDESGAVDTIVGQLNDITERKQAQERQAHQRTHDQLTGLPNHANIAVQLTRRLSSGEPAAVLFCDVDRFKNINYSLGRPVGDQLLVAVAQRLRDAIPEGCALGRVGDDEFIVLASGECDDPAVRRLGDRLLAAFRQPLAVGDIRHTLSVSIGAAVSAPRHRHADELMADAEEALRRAKRRGRARIELYDPTEDHPGTLQDLRLEQELRAAIAGADGLRIHLQPIVNIDHETVIGDEALIRWEHPERGLLRPCEFLPIAEHSGLIVDLGWRMLALGAQAAADSQHGCGNAKWVAVNVSGNQLGRAQLPSAIRAALWTNDIPPESLHLEITETALVDASPRAVEEIREIADMGVSIALDDFGTGYSSLSLLRDLPISVVKIDRSFIAPIAENRRTAALVRSVVSMCNALDIKTIAEGIETREQLALVSALGCDHAQGFLFGRPEPFAPTAPSRR